MPSEALEAGLNHRGSWGQPSFTIARTGCPRSRTADEIHATSTTGRSSRSGQPMPSLLARHGAYYRLCESQYAMITGQAMPAPASAARSALPVARGITQSENASPNGRRSQCAGHLGTRLPRVEFPSVDAAMRNVLWSNPWNNRIVSVNKTTMHHERLHSADYRQSAASHPIRICATPPSRSDSGHRGGNP